MWKLSLSRMVCIVFGFCAAAVIGSRRRWRFSPGPLFWSTVVAFLVLIVCAAVVGERASANLWKWTGWIRLFGGSGSAPIRQKDAEPPASSAVTSFDAPGAGTSAMEGTAAFCINASGEIAGIYSNQVGVFHGFVRAADGTFTSFDAPDAGTVATQGTIPVGTIPAGIDTTGDVVGAYIDANGAYHGFMRAANGTITQFDAPGASASAHRGTAALSINDSGVIVGFYTTGTEVTNSAYHGFMRAADGTITTIDAPNAGSSEENGWKPGTHAISINASGEIAGSYVDSNMNGHGFVLSTSGTFTEFDAPNAGTNTAQHGGGLYGTIPLSIDAAGDVAGTYTDTNYVHHGFLRAANGTITVFDPPGAGANPSASLQGTLPFSMDPGGNYIVGGYTDSTGMLHGFERAANGTFTSFDAPGAAAVFPYVPGTGATAVNASGTVAGVYIDANEVAHGFFYVTTTINISPGESEFFGTQLLATPSAARTVTLTNSGGSAVTISSIAVAGANSGDFGVSDNCPISPNTLASGDNCTLQATFTPQAAGPRKSSISISDNAGSGVQTIYLTGVGTAISTAPSSLTFGSQPVGTPSATMPVVIANESGTVVNLWQIAFIGPDAGDFSLSNTSTCGNSLGAGSKCMVNVTFTPAAAGSRTASLMISNDGGGSPQAVALAGTGTSGAAARKPRLLSGERFKNEE